jgi:uncharacterized membrane protein YvlD (DUF360 family)
MSNAASQIIAAIDTYIINPLLLIIFAAGLFVFMWGMFQFMVAHTTTDAGRIKEGKDHMIWGVVGMFIMVSVYGIISLLDSTFNLDVSNPDTTVNAPSSSNLFGD